MIAAAISRGKRDKISPKSFFLLLFFLNAEKMGRRAVFTLFLFFRGVRNWYRRDIYEYILTSCGSHMHIYTYEHPYGGCRVSIFHQEPCPAQASKHTNYTPTKVKNSFDSKYERAQRRVAERTLVFCNVHTAHRPSQP